MKNLEQTLLNIQPINYKLKKDIQNHLDSLTKPLGSLGKLEEMAMKFCLITNTVKPVLKKKRIVLFAGDHGVTEEGISAFPKEVTVQMVYNILDGGAAINVLARHSNSELSVIDVGVDGKLEHLALIDKKIKRGTNNIAKGTAMTINEATKALEVGIEQAEKAKAEHIDILATGEMGIGNTTSASALFAQLLPCNVEDITGRGTGINDEQLQHKISTIKKILDVNKNNFTSPLQTLAAIGGIEIAGITGLILGAASNRIPIVIDGFISSAAALVACKINPLVENYLFYSHLSAEKGHKTFYDLFKAEPTINLQMRLGEGTGAALTINLIEAAIKIYNEMATFESAGVSNND